MAISKTYIDLQRHIADDIGDRSDLMAPLLSTSPTSPIKRAIQSAIAKWEREPFYFNEFYDASFFSTVNTQEFYTASDSTKISTNITIVRLHITISSTRYMLIPRPWRYLEDIATSTTAGKPTDFAYFAQQIRLYPVPDAVYVIACSGIKRLTELSADADANAWTQDAYDLIRAEAKLILAREILFDYELAGQMELQIYGNPEKPAAKGYLAALREETALRTGALPVRGSAETNKGRMIGEVAR